jgi:hypothetical protein
MNNRVTQLETTSFQFLPLSKKISQGISPVGGNPFFGNPFCAVTVLPLDEKKTNKNPFLLFAHFYIFNKYCN